MSTYCEAASNHNYRITHEAVPGGRILVCAKCSAWFPWWDHQDHLPLHAPAESESSKAEIIARFTEES